MSQAILKRYSLTSNPFVEGKHDYPMIDRKEFMRKMQRTFTTLIASGSPQIVFLIGDYGMGKTFALLQLKSRIETPREFLGLPEGSIVVVYMKTVSPKPPGEYLTYVYSQIVTGLGRPLFAELSDAYRTLTSKEHGKLELETNFARALTNVGKKDAAWSYLRGLAVSAKDSKELDITGRIARDSDAMAALLSLLQLLYATGRKSLVILIDEFEYLLTAAGDKRAAQIIVTFKDLFDRITEMSGRPMANPIFTIASTPGAYKEIPSLASKVGLGGIEPFLSRVYKTIPLEPFSDNETRQLLETRLARRRIGDKPQSIYPFGADYVRFINTRCKGNPRKIIHYSAIVLEEADSKELTSVGAKEAKRILDKHGLP